MPAYGLSGVPTTRRTALVAGVLVMAAVVAAVVVYRGVSAGRGPDTMRIQLRTSAIGDGVVPGAGVRLNGVQIGKITSVDSTPGGTQLLTLAVRPDQLAGLGDSVRVDYAPSNLFGISEIILKPGSGGTPLHDGSIVDLTVGDRVADVTMGTLLRSLAETSQQVFTPELTEVLNKSATDIKAFAPLIDAIVGAARAVADTQRFSSSFLIEQYASFFNGIGHFGAGFVNLIDEVYHIDVLRNDRAHFEAGVTLVVDQLFPAISTLGWTAKGYLAGYSDTLATLLGQLAASMPEPDRSRTDLTDLIERLGGAFRETPGGPAVDLDIALRGVPGVAVPLLGGRVATGAPGER